MLFSLSFCKISQLLKWDGITRCAETRHYVKAVELLIIDEIHLLGVERGAVLEAIVTRWALGMEIES
jgi:replicative superfamily II helicase